MRIANFMMLLIFAAVLFVVYGKSYMDVKKNDVTYEVYDPATGNWTTQTTTFEDAVNNNSLIKIVWGLTIMAFAVGFGLLIQSGVEITGLVTFAVGAIIYIYFAPILFGYMLTIASIGDTYLSIGGLLINLGAVAGLVNIALRKASV